MDSRVLAQVIDAARDRYQNGEDPTRIRDEEAEFGRLDARVAEVVKAELLVFTRLLMIELHEANS